MSKVEPTEERNFSLQRREEHKAFLWDSVFFAVLASLWFLFSVNSRLFTIPPNLRLFNEWRIATIQFTLFAGKAQLTNVRKLPVTSPYPGYPKVYPTR
jgi:hypothetical protein